MRGSLRDAEFSEYVVARRAQLRRTAYLLCGDPHHAEDLVQTALMKLYAAWPRLRKNGNVDAFARRIVVNAHLDETRRPWRRERSGLDGLDVATGDRPGDRPGDGSSDDRDVLVAALAALPERQRQVVVLRHYWGLSVEETATDLGISAGTVKSQTSHALRHLEKALSSDFENRSRHG